MSPANSGEGGRVINRSCRESCRWLSMIIRRRSELRQGNSRPLLSSSDNHRQLSEYLLATTDNSRLSPTSLVSSPDVSRLLTCISLEYIRRLKRGTRDAGDRRELSVIVRRRQAIDERRARVVDDCHLIGEGYREETRNIKRGDEGYPVLVPTTSANFLSSPDDQR